MQDFIDRCDHESDKPGHRNGEAMSNTPATILQRLIASTGLSEWPIYHRVALAFLISIFAFGAYQAFYAHYNGTYRVTGSAVIDNSAERIWPFITNIENRARWQAYVLDITRLKGDPAFAESTRILYWRDANRRRWTAFEETLEAIPGLYYATNQKSDKDERSMAIKLEPLGDCKTLISIEERIRPQTYDNRLIAPITRLRDKARLNESFTDLKRWLEKEPCTAGEGIAQGY